MKKQSVFPEKISPFSLDGWEGILTDGLRRAILFWNEQCPEVDGSALFLTTTTDIDMAEFDQEFVEYVVRAIVNHPDDVKTDRIIDERGVLITLHVNPEDMGYVIGRQGQTARAVRTLLKIVGAKSNARVNLKIYEPEGSRRAHSTEERAAMSGNDTASVDDLGI